MIDQTGPGPAPTLTQSHDGATIRRADGWMPGPVHWLPQDPHESRITACGLDIDARYPEGWVSWSRSERPYGDPPSCGLCAALAASP